MRTGSLQTGNTSTQGHDEWQCERCGGSSLLEKSLHERTGWLSKDLLDHILRGCRLSSFNDVRPIGGPMLLG